MIPKIYECLGKDQLRPVFSYAFVTKKKTVATNANVLIAYDTKELFGEDFVNVLPDEGILLDADTLKDMAKRDVQLISLNGKIEVKHLIKGEYKTSYFDFKTQEQVATFPNWEMVIPKKTKGKVPAAIGINAKLLTQLQNAMGFDVCGVRLYFNGTNKPIICEPVNSMYESTIAIIMPMAI
jgi:hypothetical protein